MSKDADLVLKNFYRMSSPDPKYMKDRMKKIAVIIEKMGKTYCLAVPVERKT